MNNDLTTRLEAIDADCERAAKAELERLFETAPSAGPTSRGPSPQVAEAIWLKLIGRKEQEFIREITRFSKQKTSNSIEAERDAKSAEEVINDFLADERYLERMREFYAQATQEAGFPETSQAQAKRLDLIDTTYRTGVQDALRRTRENVLAELNLRHTNKGEDANFLSQWKQYSTLSPWRAIWTIVLLSLTSYIIAFVIASDAFRALLERLGWPAF